METRSSLKFFVVALFGLSLLVTGCSRQLYTAMVTSEKELGAKFANSSSSTSGTHGLASSSSLAGDGNGSPLGKSSQSLVAGMRGEGSSNQKSKKGGSESANSKAGREGNSADLHARGADGDILNNLNSGRSASGAGVGGQGAESVIESGQEFSSPLDGIMPLQGKELLTEMAAASATGELSSSAHGDSSSQGAGGGLMALGEEGVGRGALGDVFFDFDAASIRSDAAPVLRANAQLLKERFEHRQIIIEGHADERGTAEYNLVLGERRAQSSKKYLVDLGVSPSTIQTISYGKERPFCHVSNSDCWRQNLRVHFVLQ